MFLPFVAHAQEVREVEREVKVYFRQDATAFDGGYRNNNSAFSEFANEVRSYWQDTTAHLRHVRIVASVSPEGSIAVNDRTAKRRANTIVNRMRGVLDTTVHFDVVIMGADWERLDQLVAESKALPHREDVITLLETTSKSERLNALRKLHEEVPYEWMFENLFPELRYVEVSCVFYWEPTPEPEPTPTEVVTEEVVAKKAEIATEPVAEVVTDEETEIVAEVVPLEVVTEEVSNRSEKSEPVISRDTMVVALKSNMLYDALTVVNAEVEVPISRHFSVAIEYLCPWWEHNNKYCLQLVELGVEGRYWFRNNVNKVDRLGGHFLGVYGMSAMYDIQKDYNPAHQGEFWSAGLTYGYAMRVGKQKRIGLEFALSVGYLSTNYRNYFPASDYSELYINELGIGRIKYFGPTKLKVSLVVPFNIGYNKRGGSR